MDDDVKVANTSSTDILGVKQLIDDISNTQKEPKPLIERTLFGTLFSN